MGKHRKVCAFSIKKLRIVPIIVCIFLDELICIMSTGTEGWVKDLRKKINNIVKKSLKKVREYRPEIRFTACLRMAL